MAFLGGPVKAVLHSLLPLSLAFWPLNARRLAKSSDASLRPAVLGMLLAYLGAAAFLYDGIFGMEDAALRIPNLLLLAALLGLVSVPVAISYMGISAVSDVVRGMLEVAARHGLMEPVGRTPFEAWEYVATGLCALVILAASLDKTLLIPHCSRSNGD